MHEPWRISKSSLLFSRERFRENSCKVPLGGKMVSVVRILRSWQVRSALSLKVPNLHLAFWSLDAYFDGSIPLGSIFFSMSRTRNDWLGASSSSWFQWKFTYAQNIRFDVIKNNQSHLQRSMYRYVGGDYLISLSYRKILIYYEVWIEEVG